MSYLDRYHLLHVAFSKSQIPKVLELFSDELTADGKVVKSWYYSSAILTLLNQGVDDEETGMCTV